MTTKEEISGWFEQGLKETATHMIVVCDSWDHEDFPVYVKEGESVADKVQEKNAVSTLRVREVYNLKLPKDPQLDAFRSWNL